jgi:hypothetical protein
MENESDLLEDFLSNDGLIICYDLYTFDNLFKLLLKAGFSHEDALLNMYIRCDLSALVFQERIHNNKYMKMDSKDCLTLSEALEKSNLIKDLLQL